MSGGQPLPIELVLEIMLYLYVDSRERPQRYFHKLSLVCKMWTPYAQRLLFRNARLLDPGNTYGFLEATRPGRDATMSERLGECVRTVEITAHSKEMLSLVPYILRHCPNLYDLSTTVYSKLNMESIQQPQVLPPKMTTTFSDINYKSISLPQIQVLRIDSHESGTYNSWSLLKLWPNVRHLVLTGYALSEAFGPPSCVEESPVLNLQLYELQLGKSSTMDHPSDHAVMINLFLRSSTSHLTMLDLYGVDSSVIPLLEPIITQHGPYIRSLRLPMVSHTIQLPFLKHCTSIEELVMDCYPPKGVRLVLPKDKLTHVCFSAKPGQERFGFTPMIQWMESLPSLETFTWLVRKGGQKYTQPNDETEFQRACNRMGIRLRFLTVISVQLPQEYIEPPAFPRDELISPVWR